MHLSLPHGTMAAALLGVAIWLAGLTVILVLKQRAEQAHKPHASLPLTIYLILSAVVLVAVGFFYRRQHLGAAPTKLPEPKPAKPPAPKAPKPAKAETMPAMDDGLDANLWASDTDSSSPL